MLFILLWLSTDKKDCSILSCKLALSADLAQCLEKNAWTNDAVFGKKDEGWHFYILQVFVKGLSIYVCTVKLGNKELFDKEQIGIKEPFPVTNLPFTS